MTEAHALTSEQWRPLARYGFSNPFWDLNSTTLIDTWIVLGILILLAYSIRFILAYKRTVSRHLLISSIEFFVNLIEQSFGTLYTSHFYFVTSIFLFILGCNLAALIPWVEEPTQDLNTTLALGIIGFFYTQIYAIKVHGWKEYLKEYCQPFFVMFPLHVVGKLATIVSISFRLFGNIFGGATIATLYFGAVSGSLLYEVIGIASGLNILIFIFIFFESFLQAFVFTMLTTTYLAIATQHEAEGIS